MANSNKERIHSYYWKTIRYSQGVERIRIENGSKRYTGQFYNCEKDDMGESCIDVRQDGIRDTYSYRLDDIEDPYSGKNY